jgi:hypothetical protein
MDEIMGRDKQQKINFRGRIIHTMQQYREKKPKPCVN